MNIKFLKEHVECHGLKIVDGSFIEFNKNTPDFQILPNFRLQEFLTKNKKDTFTRIDLNILIELHDIRTIFGSGIGISSSYRSKEYNASQNGATSSMHMKGKALDIYPINGKIKALKEVVKNNKKTGGRGLNYNTFVHIDNGNTRTW